MKDFAARLAAIPEDLLALAKGGCWPNAPLAEVVEHAEMMMRVRSGTVDRNEDRLHFQPFLTHRQTRIIRAALTDYETVIEDDVQSLRTLREWFGSCQ